MSPAANLRSGRDRWLVSYADLMTLLFALFVVLLAAAYRKQGRGGLIAVARAEAGGRAAGVKDPAVAAAAAAAKQKLYEELLQALGGASGTGNVSVQQRAEGIVISMKEAGYFETAQAMPLPAADELLGKISAVVGPSGVQVRVEGHTDDQPINTPRFHSNWELSTARAEAVLQMLLAEARINPSRLSVAGYGSYRPIADNSTEAGRRSNRRVDLVLLTPN